MKRASQVQPLASAITNAFDDPRQFAPWWFDAEQCHAFITKMSRQAAWASLRGEITMNAATETKAHDLLDAEGRDVRELRNLLGQFATGVTVITTRTADDRNVGVTANSFSSLSLSPALVLWSLARTAPSLKFFCSASHFAINVLGAHQHHLSEQFARAATDKFAGVAHSYGKAGAPVLDDVVAVLVCRNVTQYEGGDHLIFIGEIEQYRYSCAEPLVFHAGQYRVAAAHPALAS